MNSIKIILVTGLIIFLSPFHVLKAQSLKPKPVISYGIRYMPIVAELYTKDDQGRIMNRESVFGHGFAGTCEYSLTEHFGVQGELIFNNLRQKFVYNRNKTEFRMNYINVPMLVTFNTDRTLRFNINFAAGPQIGVNVGSKLIGEQPRYSEIPNPALKVKRLDLGFAYGFGFEILNANKNMMFNAGFRGYQGFIDLGKDNSAPNSFNIIEDTKLKTFAGYFGVTVVF